MYLKHFFLFLSVSSSEDHASNNLFFPLSSVSWAGIHEKSYSQSQTQTYTQSQTQTQPYVSINSNLVFSCKILHKYMLKLKFESEIELRNILANQIP